MRTKTTSIDLNRMNFKIDLVSVSRILLLFLYSTIQNSSFTRAEKKWIWNFKIAFIFSSRCILHIAHIWICFLSTFWLFYNGHEFIVCITSIGISFQNYFILTKTNYFFLILNPAAVRLKFWNVCSAQHSMIKQHIITYSICFEMCNNFFLVFRLTLWAQSTNGFSRG